ncbi:vWA domain-containing protein [Zobellia uliginosa]|uniref:vWA domain-containing protein n=1 Tax=Zobellia uliginosa TaxID=143224 RepID=UPI0026E201B1|nr:VWA domain-containing protein [Zobellia uliginosa]MDO6517882.1 VWA domain-containing protein [Zobellia uliginosa]
MNSSSKLLLFFFSIILFASCGNADDDVNYALNTGDGLGKGQPVDKCLDLGDNELVLSIQDQYTTAPGKVSIFFKVSNSEGSPVSGLTADQFTIYEQGRNDDCFNTISPSESQARISPNEQIFSSNTLLILDLSNSVLSESVDELKAASISFIDAVMPATSQESYKMAIYWFDGEDILHELTPLTSEKSDLTAAIETINKDISSDVSTDLYGAVIKATDKASDLLKDSTKGDKIGAASVVIFTDGTDQASRYAKDAAQKKVDTADPNISFFTIGLGSEIDTQVLSDLGKNSSEFAANKDELEDTFNRISEIVSERANSFYLFEYCSPKRGGDNNLAIQVKNGSLQGAVQTKFSAEGFTGGCE